MSKKLSIKEFDKFIKTDLKARLTELYREYEILSEADLQSYVWQIISQFIAANDDREGIYKVLNKPFIKTHQIHPDIVVFKKMIPWVVFELKETKRMNQQKAKDDRQRMIDVRKSYPKLRKGYFIYLSRYRSERLFEKKKGAGARFFFEVSIILESMMSAEGLKKWEVGFKKWAKYVAHDSK